MSEEQRFNYVSVIGFNYLEPISILIENLLSLENRTPNEVQASKNENGLSSSIIVLTVLLLESAIARVKFDSNAPKPKSALRFIQENYQDKIDIAILKELYVIRDVIVHNHIWEASYESGDEAGMKLLATKLWKGSGDNKLSEVLDPDHRKTKKLGLNLFPTRISTIDAVIVFREAFTILSVIEKHGSKFINTSNQFLKFRGTLVDLRDLVEIFIDEGSPNPRST